MEITISFKDAISLFVNHLKHGRVKEKWVNVYEQTLKAPLKRLIALGLNAYPLNLEKVYSPFF